MTENQFNQFMEEARRQTHVLEQILMELKQPHVVDLHNPLQRPATKPEPKVFKIPKDR